MREGRKTPEVYVGCSVEEREVLEALEMSCAPNEIGSLFSGCAGLAAYFEWD